MDKIKVEIVPATFLHAIEIAAHVRPEDAEELWATSYSKADEVLGRALDYSEYAMTGLINDVPVCMWGVVSECLIFNDGIPWMVGSSVLNDDKTARVFLRHCRKPVMEMVKKYDKLENYVDARNLRSIRWLKYMGFTIDEVPEPYGVLRMPFHRFWMVKENNDV